MNLITSKLKIIVAFHRGCDRRSRITRNRRSNPPVPLTLRAKPEPGSGFHNPSEGNCARFCRFRSVSYAYYFSSACFLRLLT